MERCLVSYKDGVVIKNHTSSQLLSAFRSDWFLPPSSSWYIILSINVFPLPLQVYHDYSFSIPRTEATNLPKDAACLNFFENGESEYFHHLFCLFQLFDSGLKWWIPVSSWVTNLRWKTLGFAWNWVVSSPKMLACVLVSEVWE